jgi:hypothetical protein
MYEYYYTTQTIANTRNHTQKKRSNVNEKSIQRRQNWKSGKPKPGECKKKRKVENSTLPAFAKSKVGSSCGTTGLEGTTV